MDIRNQAIVIDNLCAGLGSATTSEGILKAIYGRWGAKIANSGLNQPNNSLFSLYFQQSF
jgi:hypothetical protein